MTEFIPLLEVYLKHYKDNKESFVNMLGTLEVPKQVVSCLYELFLFRKEIEPIESLPKEEKQRIWNTAKGFTKNDKDRKMISKSIYLMESIIE